MTTPAPTMAIEEAAHSTGGAPPSAPDIEAPTLEAAIGRYAALVAAPPADEAAALRLLIAREEVARLLLDQPSGEVAALQALIAADQQLRALAPAIDTLVGRETLEAWRESAQAEATAWWWGLDRLAAEREEKQSLLWSVLAGFCLAISFSVTTEISERFLSEGADFVGVFSTLIQGFLTLLASGAFLKVGQGWLRRFFGWLGIAPRLEYRWRAGLAAGLLLLVLGFRLSLPTIARAYNNSGAQARSTGQTLTAIDSFKRAISLAPDYAAAHYNLGSTYEDVLEYDDAVSEYQLAILADSRFYPAYNNLARLYILRRREYATALTLLDTVLRTEAPQEAHIRYTLLKNRGWAYFGLGLFRLAEQDLRQALTHNTEGAAAYCLLAQTLEARERPQAESLEAWERCVAFARGDVETNWLGMANERFQEEEGESP